MICFISFANTSYTASLDRLKFECDEIGIFDSVDIYSEKDFDEEYWEKYSDHFSEKYKRGYGYWSWKPYFLKKKLSEIQDGDIVIYADIGCMFLPSNKKVLLEWIEIAKNSKSGILSPCYGPYIEHDWTRGDLYTYINDKYNKDNVDIFDRAVQCGAGILVVAKNPTSVEFMTEWNDVMSEHFHLCTDEPSTLPNHPNFRENRHDQSAFSMLSKIYGIETIEFMKVMAHKEISPIIPTRCRNDKDTWKKPITVLFDNQIYDLQKFGGISRTYVDLHEEFSKNEIVENYNGGGLARGKYQEIFSKFAVEKTDNIYLKDVKPYEYGKCDNYVCSMAHLAKGDFDIFYPTFFNSYFLKLLNGKPFVMSIHDMIPEIYTDFFPPNDMQIVGKRLMAERASAIEVPSETTKRDVLKFLDVDESKIHVVGRGISNTFGQQWYVKNIVGSDYILYVGNRAAYKRFDWFVKHIKPFMESHKEIKVICTGSRFTPQEVSYLQSLGLIGRVYTYTPNELELATLYKHALCFVYPSEYEGFGIPILESYKMGCPTLLNDNDCFREVTFGEGEYFSLTNDESNLSDRLEEIISRPRESFMGIRDKLLTTYTWKQTATKLTEVFKTVVNQ